MSQSNTDFIFIIIEFFSLIVSIFISLLLYITSRKIETQNFSNSLRNSWISIDSNVLSNDELLSEADFLLHPEHRNDSLEMKRRRWLCYMIGNTLSVNYNGITHKLLPDPEASKASLIKSLEGLTQHPEFMDITKYFYEKDFILLCEEIQKKKATQSGNI